MFSSDSTHQVTLNLQGGVEAISVGINYCIQISYSVICIYMVLIQQFGVESKLFVKTKLLFPLHLTVVPYLQGPFSSTQAAVMYETFSTKCILKPGLRFISCV